MKLGSPERHCAAEGLSSAAEFASAAEFVVEGQGFLSEAFGDGAMRLGSPEKQCAAEGLSSAAEFTSAAEFVMRTWDF